MRRVKLPTGALERKTKETERRWLEVLTVGFQQPTPGEHRS
jgi:hypothetical protein